MANDLGIYSLAFPAISTGGYGYPPAQAALVAVQTRRACVTRVSDSTLVAFNAETQTPY